MSSTTQSAALSAKCAAWAQERRPFTHPIEIPAASGAPDERRGRGEEEEGGEVEPPHVLMARRRAASSYTKLARGSSQAQQKTMLREDQDEEFHEADILWPDAAQDPVVAQVHYSQDDGDEDDDEYSGEDRRPTKAPNRQKASSPIDIPGKTGRATGAKAPAQQAGFSKFGASLAGAGGASGAAGLAGAGGASVMIGSQVFVPPHVIVDRRAKRDTAMLMLLDAPKVGRVRAMVMLE
uniref:Uncharacterized protein n=1 Tax=Aegilops tauschii TaxID=37682 RepID=R7WGM1_AEGTA